MDLTILAADFVTLRDSLVEILQAKNEYDRICHEQNEKMLAAHSRIAMLLATSERE